MEQSFLIGLSLIAIAAWIILLTMRLNNEMKIVNARLEYLERNSMVLITPNTPLEMGVDGPPRKGDKYDYTKQI